MINPILSDWFFNHPHPHYEALCKKYHDEGKEVELVFGETYDDEWSECNEVTKAITQDAIQFCKDNQILFESVFPEYVGAAEKLADDFMRRL